MLPSELLSPEHEVIPGWLRAWKALAPSLSTPGLEALAKALQEDDPRLTQGATTLPPPLQYVLDWPVEGACATSFCGWIGDGLETVGQVEEFFARACFDCDQRLGEPAGCRHFLNFFDEAPREEVRRDLLPAVEATLQERREQCPTP